MLTFLEHIRSIKTPEYLIDPEHKTSTLDFDMNFHEKLDDALTSHYAVSKYPGLYLNDIKKYTERRYTFFLLMGKTS